MISGSYFSGELGVGSDPSLHLFLVATGPTFPFRWRRGRRRIFLLSLGAGVDPVFKRQKSSIGFITALSDAMNSMLAGLNQRSGLVLAGLTHQDANNSFELTQKPPSTEGSLSPLHYVNLNVQLESKTLSEIGLADLAPELEFLLSRNRADRIESHLEIGRRAADHDLNSELFSPSFDVRPRPKDS